MIDRDTDSQLGQAAPGHPAFNLSNSICMARAAEQHWPHHSAPFAPRVSPNCHDGVANKFVEGAAEAENAFHHGGQVFIELANECLWISPGTHDRVAANIRKQDGNRPDDPT